MLVKQELKEIHYHLPENLTRESYIQIYRKKLAAIRHSIWRRMQAKGIDKLTEKDYYEMKEEIDKTE